MSKNLMDSIMDYYAYKTVMGDDEETYDADNEETDDADNEDN